MHLIGNHQRVASVVPFDARRSLEDLMTEVEVEIEQSVSISVRRGAEQANATVTGVGDDQFGVMFVGCRQSAWIVELVRTCSTASEPTKSNYIM